MPFFYQGATHEHMRLNRNGFVKILLQNVQPDAQKNFQAKSSDAYSMHRTPFRRGCPGCAKLGSNKVIVEQGIGDGTRHQTTEILDLTTRKISKGGNMVKPRYSFHNDMLQKQQL